MLCITCHYFLYPFAGPVQKPPSLYALRVMPPLDILFFAFWQPSFAHLVGVLQPGQGLNNGGMPMKCTSGKGGTCNCGGMAKNKMSKGGMPKKNYGNGGMAKKGYRNGGFCTGPAKGYKK